MVLIAGGDRHGLEPNANINLTNATCFDRIRARDSRGEEKQDPVHAPVCGALEASHLAVGHRCGAPLS